MDATPDFYTYRWDPVASARIDGHFVELVWPDGLSLMAYDQWLAENIVGHTIDAATRESVFDPADIDPDQLAAPTMQAEVTVSDDGALAVDWAGGPFVRYHPGWLRHVAEGRHRPSAGLPVPRPWSTDDLSEPATTPMPTMAKDADSDVEVGVEVDVDDAVDDAVGKWTEDLLRFGLARLENCPIDPEFVATLGARFGAIRDTNFGPTWDVKADIDPGSTANTNYRLAPHTDLPTRETPPGFQMLHCLANTVDGGWSTMTDGLAVVEHFARTEPEHYEALTTLRWVFFNRGRSVDHRWSGPVIDLGSPGSPMTIRAFHPVRGFPDMAPEDQPRAYAALADFSRLTADPRFQIRFAFRPGDLVGFDNRRVLHGRDAYSSRGRRHLRGLYIDHDEIYSYARRRARITAPR